MKKSTTTIFDQSEKSLQFDWLLERIGSLVLLSIVVLMLTGVFGKDPNAWRVAGQENERLWANYERYARWQTDTKLEIHARVQEIAAESRISINADYLRDMRVKQIIPKPDSVWIQSDQTTFVFKDGGKDEFLVARFYLEPEKPGKKEVIISMRDAPPIHFWQFVYP